MLANGGRNKQACTHAVVCLQNFPLQYFAFKMLSKQPFFFSQFLQVFLSIIVNFILLNFPGRLFFFLCTLMKRLLATLSGCLCSCVGVGLLLAVANRECVLTKAQQLPSMMPKWWWSGDTMKLGRAVLIVYYGCQRVGEDMRRGAATQHSIS